MKSAERRANTITIHNNEIFFYVLYEDEVEKIKSELKKLGVDFREARIILCG